ncbi:MAG: twin-arginine translocation signal domain-containing protein, partial [Pseudomonadales bacterium]|nr:twin-arginine translocation signal domain-containing protein [Pseudomonadales bacterium]
MSEVSRRSFITHTALLGGGLAAGFMAPGAQAAVTQAAAGAAAAAKADPLLAFRSGLELAELIRSKALSSAELTRYFIARIERFDGRLNAIVVRTFEAALESARAADAALAKGQMLGALHGLPMTIKESFNLKGTATTWGLPDLANNIATTDSAMVTRYRKAGAHFMGKTNVPLMLGDFQSYNDVYGTTSNPWNTQRTPGGSSGGSAAALAAGLTGLDSGSDIGGS